ncbi:hypothetical protein GCM10010302_74600 [Streptomyces polychromogenes]|uniref:Uncharacterized protein n=1 Tax=Streptomyces polychromogenes TaxID=67342 RepID=A0ABP3FV96_9ACTN
MSEGKSFGLEGETISAAFAVKYLPEGEAGLAEGVEFVLASGSSVILWNGTDWTLRISGGDWPRLPEWAWPPESWTFSRIDDLGHPGLDEVLTVNAVHNEVGELYGVRIEFPAATLTVSSGNSVTWLVTPKP